MRKLALLLMAIVLAGCCGVPSFGGTIGSGRVVDKEYPLTGFDRVEASHAFQVQVSQAANYSVVVSADDNILPDVEVTLSGDTLRIGLRPGRNYARATLRARIALPSLRGVGLSGASQATITGFQSSSDLDLHLSGAASLRGDIRAGNLRAGLSGASRLTLAGSGQRLELNGSGGSNADLLNWPASDAVVHLSGGSRADVNVSGHLDAELSGGAHLEYAGKPTLGRVETSGGASIHQR